MDLNGLAVFSAVAKAGGITKAARILNTVQSNVTARVRQLEEELGVALFERHSRGVSLTKAGARLLDYSQKIAHLVDDARRAVTDDLTLESTLALGSTETTGAIHLNPALMEFTRDYPNVDLVLKTAPSKDLIESVLSGSLEGAFVAGPITHPELTGEEILIEELVLVAAPGVKKGQVFGSDQRNRPKAVVFRSGCSYRERLESLMINHGISSPRTLELGTLDGIIDCVAAGLGISFLPRAAVAEVARTRRISIHSVAASDARVSIVVVKRRDAYQSHALETFLDYVRRKQLASSGLVSVEKNRARQKAAVRKASGLDDLAGNPVIGVQEAAQHPSRRRRTW